MIKYGERVLETKDNRISIACTLMKLPKDKDPTFVGSYLFSRRVSGLWVCSFQPKKKFCDIEFENYGAHQSTFDGIHLPYFTTAAAMG